MSEKETNKPKPAAMSKSKPAMSVAKPEDLQPQGNAVEKAKVPVGAETAPLVAPGALASAMKAAPEAASVAKSVAAPLTDADTWLGPDMWKLVGNQHDMGGTTAWHHQDLQDSAKAAQADLGLTELEMGNSPIGQALIEEKISYPLMDRAMENNGRLILDLEDMENSKGIIAPPEAQGGRFANSVTASEMGYMMETPDMRANSYAYVDGEMVHIDDYLARQGSPHAPPQAAAPAGPSAGRLAFDSAMHVAGIAGGAMEFHSGVDHVLNGPSGDAIDDIAAYANLGRGALDVTAGMSGLTATIPGVAAAAPTIAGAAPVLGALSGGAAIGTTVAVVGGNEAKSNNLFGHGDSDSDWVAREADETRKKYGEAAGVAQFVNSTVNASMADVGSFVPGLGKVAGEGAAWLTSKVTGQETKTMESSTYDNPKERGEAASMLAHVVEAHDIDPKDIGPGGHVAKKPEDEGSVSNIPVVGGLLNFGSGMYNGFKSAYDDDHSAQVGVMKTHAKTETETLTEMDKEFQYNQARANGASFLEAWKARSAQPAKSDTDDTDANYSRIMAHVAKQGGSVDDIAAEVGIRPSEIRRVMRAKGVKGW
jgi:hypothetical protein